MIDENEYKCLECPLGHTGLHCEKCDDGFFGNPMEIGSKCQACDCKGDPCHPITGECIKCEGNTEGWRCERCKKGFHGSPESGCQVCECSESGSVSNICDPLDGKCACKPHYTGKYCNQCIEGYTMESNECVPCSCNINGSRNQNCDINTGQCDCKINIHGLKCDECNEEFFGLNYDGCEGEFPRISQQLMIYAGCNLSNA